jgi:DNA repair protein RecN (Recombination protein N)
MLTQLRVRDFAIVEQLELELAGGMTAVTGETGAGKSILVDAIGLLLGDRADSGTIRHGAGTGRPQRGVRPDANYRPRAPG